MRHATPSRTWPPPSVPVGAAQMDGPVLDVRQEDEYEAGHLPASRHVELGDLPAEAGRSGRDGVTVMCASGHRAMTGASLLEAAGYDRLRVSVGSAEEWSRAHGRRLDTGT
jgi:hydroxyacylglutathione hydrolase